MSFHNSVSELNFTDPPRKLIENHHIPTESFDFALSDFFNGKFLYQKFPNQFYFGDHAKTSYTLTGTLKQSLVWGNFIFQQTIP